jgi:curved DNA-binding protein
MSAPVAGKFQDHYHVLGVEPGADSETIQKAYSKLAARFHPNNKDTGDPEKFKAVNQAYEVLADPGARQAFDELRGGPKQEAAPKFSGAQFFDVIAGETIRRQSLLCVLYDRRQKKPATPGLSMRQIESMIKISQEELQFSIWYLKQRSYVASDDKSNLTITVQGMEHLEQNLPSPDAILSMVRLESPAA